MLVRSGAAASLIWRTGVAVRGVRRVLRVRHGGDAGCVVCVRVACAGGRHGRAAIVRLLALCRLRILFVCMRLICSATAPSVSPRTSPRNKETSAWHCGLQPLAS